MCKSKGKGKEMNDVVQMGLVLADFLGETAGFESGLGSSSQFHSLGLGGNRIFFIV